jgi:signal transduction histidine kinase
MEVNSDAVKKAEIRMQRIFELFTELSDNKSNHFERVLEVATELVEMDIGIISKINQDQYKIEGVHAFTAIEFSKGQEFNLGDTYCSITYENNRVIDLNQVGTSKYKGHPCYVNTQLEAYIGVPIFVNGKIYGTLNFSSSSPRKVLFNQFDRDFLLYLSQWIGQHITRLAYEEQLSSRNKKLRQLLSERKKLTSILIHDLKAPLSNLNGLMELSQSMTEDTVISDMMKSSLKSAFDLIKDLQEVNQLDQGSIPYSPTRINGVKSIEVVINNFINTAAEKSIELVLIAKEEHIALYTDEKLLHRILTNLLSNAIKFSPPKTIVEIFIRQANGQIYFAFKDNGPGINEVDQKKLFGRFQKLSARPTANENSSGLGLFIVKEIAQLIGGQVKAQSKLGEGSTFELSLNLPE